MNNAKMKRGSYATPPKIHAEISLREVIIRWILQLSQVDLTKKEIDKSRSKQVHMHECLNLMGIGYNYLLPEVSPFLFSCDEFLQERYESEAHEMASHLIDNDQLDALEMEEYKEGDCLYEEVYKVALDTARADISQNILERNYENGHSDFPP